MAPSDYEAFRERVQSSHDGLSRRLKQVASFVLDNPQAVAFDTVAEAAEAANVHGSTLVRFAHRFGFSGYSEMQQLIKRQQVAQLPDYSERIRMLQTRLGASDDMSAPHLLDEFITANMMSLEHMRNQIDPEDLQRAVELMDGADTVYICGVRRAFPVSMYFTYALSHIHVRSDTVDGLGYMSSDRLETIGPGDVFIAITFRPYSSVTLESLNIATRNGARVIVITDSDVAPVVRNAEIAFVIKDAEVRSFRSLTSTLCLAQTLCIALGYRRESKGKAGRRKGSRR